MDMDIGISKKDRQAVAAGLSPNLVMSTFGTFRGLGANSTLTTEVSVETV